MRIIPPRAGQMGVFQQPVKGLPPAAALHILLRDEKDVFDFAEDGALVGVLIFGESGGTSLAPSCPRASDLWEDID
jgi:hypothetical protein